MAALRVRAPFARHHPRRAAPLAALAGAVMWACGEPAAPEPPEARAYSIEAPSFVYVLQWRKAQINAVVRDSAGAQIYNAPLTYTSSDPAVLAVSDGGVVTSVGRAGTVPVTLRSGSATTVVDVGVLQVPGSIEGLGDYVINLAVGDSAPVGGIQVLDLAGDTIREPFITISSDRPTVARVTAQRWILALRPGAVTIRFTSDQVAVDKFVVVYDPAVIHGQVRVSAPSGLVVQESGMLAVAQWVLPRDAALGGVVIVDPDRRVKVDSLFPQPLVALTVGTDDRHLLATDLTGSLYTLDLTVGSMAPLAGQAGRLFTYGQGVYALAGERIRRLDPATGAVLADTALITGLRGVAPGPADSLIYVTAHYGGRVFEMHAQTLAVRRELWVGGEPEGAVLGPDGRHLYVANAARGLDVVDLEAWQQDTIIPLGVAGDLCLSADGRAVFVALADSGRVVELDLASLTVTRTILTSGRPTRPRVTADGRYVVTSNGGGWVDVIYARAASP